MNIPVENLSIKMAIDWIDSDTNRVLLDAQELTNDDRNVNLVLAHLLVAHNELKKAIAEIAVAKEKQAQQRKGRCSMNPIPQPEPVVMPLGLHVGKPIRELDTRYLSWCCKNSRIFVDHLAFIPALKSELKRRRRR